MSRRRSAAEIREAKLLGRALAALRVSRGMTQRQVAERTGITRQQVCKAERGMYDLRQYTLGRILEAMGASPVALNRARQLVQDPMGEVADTPGVTREEAHRAALRLAQEAGKAVAHCCLAFMELQAGGWPQAPAREDRQ